MSSSTPHRLLLVTLALLGLACGSSVDEPPASTRVVDGDPPLVLFLGDSLAAGYGLPEDEAFPAVLRDLLAERGKDIEIINAGVSGDTSTGGLNRLDWVLESEPDLVFIELGANDGLRGQSVETMEANLRAIVDGVRAAGARPLLTGMQMPPNYGPEYAGKFKAVFPRVADELDVPFFPFLLKDVAAKPKYNLGDLIHPNREGHRIIAENLLDFFEDALDDLEG
ncbi:MAG: arylesterase [Acidobacteriota bacterium]